MLPHIGQGAAQSIEDAAILGVLCSELPDASAIPERLKLFENVRKQRVSAIQILSRPPVGVNSTEQVTAELRAYFPVGKIPSMSLTNWSVIAFLTDEITINLKRTEGRPQRSA